MNNRPKIGLSMRLDLDTNRFYLGRQYSEALEYFGAVPVQIPLIAKREYLTSLVRELDGILLPGSDTDVDPYYYQKDPHPKLKTVVPEKDETDFLLLGIADELEMPVLGICFGMQILNVHFGGNLFQDINSEVKNSIKHEQGSPLERQSHTIKVKDESIISNYLIEQGLHEVKVNSHHHQSVNVVGKGLHATAWANDGVIECIEQIFGERYVLGVQWHPEIGYKNDSLSEIIFRKFIEACAAYSISK